MQTKLLNKSILFFTLFLFVFQTMLPPVLLSSTQAPAKNKALEILIEDKLFDEHMTFPEKFLISQLVHYVFSSMPLREALRETADHLNKIIEKDQFWFSMQISNPDMADLVQDANISRKFLISDTKDMQSHIHSEQERLEAILAKAYTIIERDGAVPDGFLEQIRSLSYLYDLQDDLWGIKMQMLFHIQAVSKNLSMNYLSRSPVYNERKNSVDQAANKINELTGQATSLLQQLSVLRGGFEYSQVYYHGAIAAEMKEDLANTKELIQVISNRSDFLMNSGGSNSIRHAKLLRMINITLDERLAIVNNKLGSIGALETFANPLHIPSESGKSSTTAPLANEYRDIVKRLLGNTNIKLNSARKINLALSGVKQSIAQELVFFQSLASESGDFSRFDLQAVNSASADSEAELRDSLAIIDSTLNRIINLGNRLNLNNPESIMTSELQSSLAFRLNREIETLVMQGREIDQLVKAYDLKLYALLINANHEHLDRLNSFSTLEKVNVEKYKALDIISEAMLDIQKAMNYDAELAEQLKSLGMKITLLGHDFFQKKSSRLADLLNQSSITSENPYFDFLVGVQEELQHRSVLLNEIVSLANDLEPLSVEPVLCLDCPGLEFIWEEMAMLDDSLSDALWQIDSLTDIESFYTSQAINSDDRFTHASNMFAIMHNLGEQPHLFLNPQSIDVAFTVGSKVVVLKGVGDPDDLILAGLSTGIDHLLYPPYIGQSRWIPQRLINVWDRHVVPAGQSISKSASNFLESASETAGKYRVTFRQGAQRAAQNIRNVVDTVADFGSATLTGVRDWASNTWKETSWLKIATYSISGVACGVAAVKTMGTALIACKKILAALKSDALLSIGKGYIQTLSQYGTISDEWAKTLKTGLTWAKFLHGGYKNVLGAKNWAGMSNLQKYMTFMGLKPGKAANFFHRLSHIEWSKVKDKVQLIASLGLTLKESLDAASGTYDWMKDQWNNATFFSGLLPSFSNLFSSLKQPFMISPGFDRNPFFPFGNPFGPMVFDTDFSVLNEYFEGLKQGLGDFSGWLKDNLPGLTGPIPSLKDYFFKDMPFYYNPLMPFNNPFSPLNNPFLQSFTQSILDSASGVLLPAGSSSGQDDSPGFSLIPDTKEEPAAHQVDRDLYQIDQRLYQIDQNLYRIDPRLFRTR